mmetsp:Transcript_27859/g.71731  ORF Transcript_27859/g.71731 Transcript_27859/m.71731 type:complete len:463 (+) Transcript_27859:274-1662(+)
MMVAVHTAPAATFGFAVRSAAALLLAAFLLAPQATASARLLGSETPLDIGGELPPVVPAHAGRSLQAAFDHTSPLINDNTVVFYEDSNFGGREHVFQVGNFVNVPRNDRYSSARIGRNVFAEVFEDSAFRGARTDVVIDVPTMERRGWNDVISSLKVKTRPAEGVALFVDVTNSDGSVVALQGRRTVIKFVESPADLTVSSLRLLGLRNDDLSEIHVPPGVTATVFRDNSFFGPSRFLPGPIVAKLTSVKFEDDSSANDRVSSIRIRSAADAFNSKVGRWTAVQSFNDDFVHQVTQSYSSEDLSSTLTGFEQTLTQSLEAGFEFPKGGGVSSSIEASVARSVVQQVSNVIGVSIETTCTMPCNIGEKGDLRALHVFSMAAQRESFNTIINSCLAICLPIDLEPQCPPGNCKDNQCQECLSESESRNPSAVKGSVARSLVQPLVKTTPPRTRDRTRERFQRAP